MPELHSSPAAGVGLFEANLMQSGQYYGTNAASITTAARANGLLEASPIFLPSLTLDRIRLDVTVAGEASAVVRAGIYADNGLGQPGPLLLDAGTQAAASIATLSWTISQTVRGLIWVAKVTQLATVTPPTHRTVTSSGHQFMPRSSVTTSARFSGYSSGTTVTTGALPATFGTATLSGGAPFIDVRVA